MSIGAVNVRSWKSQLQRKASHCHDMQIASSSITNRWWCVQTLKLQLM